MRLTASAEIDAAPEVVWRCIDEPEKILQWVEGAVTHRYLGDPPAGDRVGQRFHQSLKQGSKITEFEGTLIACDHPRHFAFTIPSPSYSSEAHFRLTPLDGRRTRVDYSIDVTLHTLKAKVGATLLRIPLTFFVPRQMQRLRALAESLAKESR